MLNKKSSRGDMRLGSGMTFGAWHIKTLTNLAEIQAHEQEWLALERESVDPHAAFQSYVWCESWAREFCKRFPDLPQPRIFFLYKNERLTAILPMMISSYMGVRILTLFGEPHSQIANIIMRAGHNNADGINLCLAQASFLTDADVIALGPIAEGSALLAALDTTYITQDPAERLSIADWNGIGHVEDYETSLSKNRRRDFRRHMKLAEAEGALRYHLYEPNDADFAQHVETALKYKQQWLRDKGIFSIGLTRQGHDSFLKTLSTAQGAFYPELELLTLNGETMAYNINLVGLGERLRYLASYNPQFIHLSPGMLLDQHSVRNGINTTLSALNYLGFPTSYKTRWSNKNISLFRYRKAVTLRGTLWIKVWTETVRPATKSLFISLRKLSTIPIIGTVLGRTLAGLSPRKK